MMKRPLPLLHVFLGLLLGAATSGAQDHAKEQNAPAGEKVYGQWLIRVQPDQGAAYDTLIETKGLPLFRGAGGRMVGWWKTGIGDLYEHVTIWEYDSLAAFEKAGASLGKNEQFAEFVKLRDPLLAGEESQFLKLAPGGEPPKLPEDAKVVLHEVHRVPFSKMNDYLSFMTTSGRDVLGKHGFRVVGPLVADVGKWSEITYLFLFESLAERVNLRAAFGAHQDAARYGAKLGEFVDEVTTRILNPAPFARTAGKAASRAVKSALLPHLAEVVPGVFAAGFADRHGSANCGWVVLADETVLIDVPRGVDAAKYLAEVERISGKPPRTLVLTRLRDGDADVVRALSAAGIQHLVTTKSLGEMIPAPLGTPPAGIELIAFDNILGMPAAAVLLSKQGVLFGGPLVVNGPRANLESSNTERWIAALARLESLGATHVVPGFGSWAASDPIGRQLGFLRELRRQVGFVISQGRPKEALATEVRIGAEHLVWHPYDTPIAADVEHVYQEMTVPAAPFGGVDPKKENGPHALVLYADQPHEPGYLVEGLPRVFAATGVQAHFSVDVRAITPENLAKIDLLVILRDGLQRPDARAESQYVWMTQAQQDAIVEFVERGGAFLNLHNSMGLYPPSGGYLELVGGRYIGHGPLERFRVEVVDKEHPITRGVSDFSVADEQHTPPYDKDKVHLLLQNRSDDGTVAAAGWAYEPGKGRLCHLANGHTREALLHPMYQRLLQNAVNWCLRRDTAHNGEGDAPCE